MEDHDEPRVVAPLLSIKGVRYSVDAHVSVWHLLLLVVPLCPYFLQFLEPPA